MQDVPDPQVSQSGQVKWEKIPLEIIVKLSYLNTLDEALLLLEKFNKSKADKLFNNLSNTIEKRSFDYVNRYTKTDMKIGLLFFGKELVDNLVWWHKINPLWFDGL